MLFPRVNPTLIQMAQEANRATERLAKQAFVASDPAAGGAPAAGGDPAAAGGMPPGDPAAAGGGAPPGGGDPMAALQPMIQQAVQSAMQQQQMMGGGAAGGAGAAGGMKPPKMDQNVVNLLMLKLLGRICDGLQIQVPVSEMIATQGDMTAFTQQLAMGQGAATPMTQATPAGQPGAAGPGAMGPGGGAPPAELAPPEPMPGAAPGMGKVSHLNNGHPFDPSILQESIDHAQAVSMLISRRAA